MEGGHQQLEDGLLLAAAAAPSSGPARLVRQRSLPSLPFDSATATATSSEQAPLCIPRLGLVYAGGGPRAQQPELRGPGGRPLLDRLPIEVMGNAEFATSCQHQRPLHYPDADVGVEYVATNLAKLGGIFTPAANVVSMSMTLGNVVVHGERDEQVDLARSSFSFAMDSISLGLWLGSIGFPPLAIAAISVSAVDFGVGLYLDGTADLVADGER